MDPTVFIKCIRVHLKERSAFENTKQLLLVSKTQMLLVDCVQEREIMSFRGGEPMISCFICYTERFEVYIVMPMWPKGPPEQNG
ncbi:hypothetical protein YC2023_044008 [Brassica napus]